VRKAPGVRRRADTLRVVQPAVALTVAGSDSGGGAGLQADLATFAAFGVFGTSAVTAVTAQHTAAVLAVHPIPPELVDLQIAAVLADLPVAAVKTGMLSSSATIRVVAARAERGELPNLVVDPVLVASTGRPLLDDRGPATYLDVLIPHARVVTPNRREAELLSGISIDDVDAMVRAGERLAATGAEVVVVKGGHLDGMRAPDVVTTGADTIVLDAERVETVNDHGTGCTLSAAIAAGLAGGAEPAQAIEAAKRYVWRAISGAASWSLGAGRGPVDHYGWGAPDTRR
jgi:hydroxymethylpyrimidine/phosphomethylpyrimidine kinase